LRRHTAEPKELKIGSGKLSLLSLKKNLTSVQRSKTPRAKIQKLENEKPERVVYDVNDQVEVVKTWWNELVVEYVKKTNLGN